MEIFKRTDTGMRALLVAAALVVVISGLRAAQPIIVPFLASAMIAILFLPAIAWLQSRRVPDWLAVTLVLIGVLGVFTLITLGVTRSIVDFNSNLTEYEKLLTDKFGLLQDDAVERLRELGIPIPAGVAESPPSGDASAETTEPLKHFDPSVILRYFGDVAGAAADLLSNAFLIVLTVAFILGEAAGFPRKLAQAFGGQEVIEGESRHAVAAVREYLRIKTELSLATGVLAGTGCAVLGIHYPVLWGSVAFALNFVPNVGSIVAAAPPILLAFVQYDWEHALAIAIIYGVINTVLGNVIEPRLMGRKLGLSSLVVWLSLVFWGWVWGPVGMLLSVPLTMLVKLLLERSDDLRWVAVLLGPADEEVPTDPIAQASEDFARLGAAPAESPRTASRGPDDDA